MLIGTYEKAGVPWAERETPWNFTHELLPPDLDRIAPSLEVGFRHFPALERAGIKRIDQRAVHVRARRQSADRADSRAVELLGRLRRDGRIQPGRRRRPRARELDGRRRSGLRRLGDGRRALRRLGDARRTRNAKVRENYSRRFRIRFPNEELPAARPLRTTPVVRPAEGARRGVRRGVTVSSTRCGSRRRARSRARTSPTAARTRTAPSATNAARCAAPSACSRSRRSRATKSRAPARDAWLDRVLANRLPREGRIALSPMLNEQRQADRRLHRRATRDATATSSSAPASPSSITCAGSSAHLPDARRGAALAARRVAGLRHRRAAIARAAGARVRRTTSRTRRCRSCRFARSTSRCLPAHVGRISFTGELGYEIWVRGGRPGRALRRARRRRRRSRARAFRRARAPFAAARKELRQLGARIPADLHAGGGGPRSLRRSRRSRISSAAPPSCATGRRARRGGS